MRALFGHIDRIAVQQRMHLILRNMRGHQHRVSRNQQCRNEYVQASVHVQRVWDSPLACQ